MAEVEEPDEVGRQAEEEGGHHHPDGGSGVRQDDDGLTVRGRAVRELIARVLPGSDGRLGAVRVDCFAAYSGDHREVERPLL